MNKLNECAGSYNPVKGLKINACDNNWVTFHIDGNWCQAKVFSDPSTYGINNGRVSKLSIINGERDPERNFLDQCIFNYDGGLDFDNGASAILNKILKIFA